MTVVDLRGKKALLVGLGLHEGGAGVVRYLVSAGADVTVTDRRDANALAPSLTALDGLPVRYRLGGHEGIAVMDYDLVVRNPAVPRTHRSSLPRAPRGADRDGNDAVPRCLPRSSDWRDGDQGQDHDDRVDRACVAAMEARNGGGREHGRVGARPASADHRRHARGARTLVVSVGGDGRARPQPAHRRDYQPFA